MALNKTEKEGNFKENNHDDHQPQKSSLKDHKNPIIRFFARIGYGMWIVILGIGGILAFLVTIIAL